MRYCWHLMKCGLKIWQRSRVLQGAATVFLFCVFAALADAQGAAFQDYFTNRETIFTTNGTLIGDNSMATVETGEPKHGGKVGGHSLWISWVAPTNGVATFDTHGSSFDTLISAYTLNSTNATQVTQLHEEARNDDDPGFEPTSLIQIGAIAGHSYQIAVDGYEGDAGTVLLHWSFLAAASPPPIIVNTPNDLAAKQGDPVTLTVNIISSGNIQFQWYFNGLEDTNQNGTNFVITSLQDTNVGRYQMRVTVGNGNNRVRFYTSSSEVQINSEGSSNTLAVDKILDSSGSALIGDDGGGPGFFPPTKKGYAPPPPIGVVRGYNGSQVFNTTFATTDPTEPAHCGNPARATYWLMYQPPANGTMTLDTIGSTYDTVMEIYTFNGPLVGYTNLISLACDNDGVSLHGPSRVVVQAVKSRQYVVVVDGINGARGAAWLNYTLNTNQPALPPQAASLVVTQTVLVGANLTLAPAISGEQPMVHTWKKNGTNIAGVTVPVLSLPNVSNANIATYTLTTTNDLGSLTVSNIVRVVTPVNCTVTKISGAVNLAFPTAANLRYTIQSATNVAGPWAQWAAPFTGAGENFSTNIAGPGMNFFRVRIE